jgi:ribosomal protein L28
MARVCQVSGKRSNHAKHIRHRHSGQWKFRAPKKNRIQGVNLQKVTIQTKHGKVRLMVAASIMKSDEFAAVVSGLKPIPKSWLKKPDYGV